MGNRSRAYWIFIIVALVVAISAMVMVRSADAHQHELGRYLGWGAIALLVIARFAFRRKTTPEPPMPKD
jgi:hypothetical protein